MGMIDSIAAEGEHLRSGQDVWFEIHQRRRHLITVSVDVFRDCLYMTFGTSLLFLLS
jgi:hypothetical protein